MDTANLLFDTMVKLTEIWIFVPAGLCVVCFLALAYHEWVLRNK